MPRPAQVRLSNVYSAFAEAAREAPRRPFLAAPNARHPVGFSYAEAAAEIERLRQRYARAGWGEGHRVTLLFGNEPGFLLHWLALNSLGAGVVPINPDHRAAELAYQIGHSDSALVVALPERVGELRAVASALSRNVPVVPDAEGELPRAPSPAVQNREACAVLYTSGTTGKPKGCLLSDEYFIAAGRWYLAEGGLCAIREAIERMLTPLPLFHMNAMAFSFMAMVLSRGCLVLFDRFHPSSWWTDVEAAGATIVHYLGVMPAMLLARPSVEAERRHRVRFGFGAGVDPLHHRAFEERFGFPLVEAWAMTESGAGGCVAASREPRQVGTRCFGAPRAGSVEIRIVDEHGTNASRDCRGGIQGELLVRHAGPDPRHGFFSGYLKDSAATEALWRDGWLHTGDVVRESGDGSLCFVDRSKNVIRRSGENISALEVEALLQQSPLVRQVAVIAVPDPVRGEEVMACVVPAEGVAATEQTAAALAGFCLDRLAYYKAPGYVVFLDALPLTGTQKVQKTALAGLAVEPGRHPRCFDLRRRKRRRNAA